MVKMVFTAADKRQDKSKCLSNLIGGYCFLKVSREADLG